MLFFSPAPDRTGGAPTAAPAPADAGAVAVVSTAVPGRLRLAVAGLHQSPGLAHRLTAALLSLPGIRSVSASPLTGRVLLHFDPAGVAVAAIVRAVAAIAAGAGGGAAPAAAPGAAPPPSRQAAPAPDPQLRRQALAVAATGAVLGGVAVKRWLTGPGPLARSLRAWDVAGVTTVVAAYPVLRRGLRALAHGRFNDDLLVGAAGLTALVLRENLLGLSVLWLAGLMRLVHLASAQRLRCSASPPLPAPAAAEAGEAAATEPAAHRLVPLALGAAALAGLAGGGRRALAVLVAASPAAAALAGSTTAAAGLAGAARRGLWLADATALAAAGAVDTVLFAEPGVLIAGPPAVGDVIPLSRGQTAAGVLAAAAAGGARDALGEALVRQLPAPGPVDGAVRVGRRDFALGGRAPTRRVTAEATRLEHLGQAVVYVARADRVVGLIGLRSHLHPAATATVEALRCTGVAHLGILSAAGPELVHPVAQALGIPHTWAGTPAAEQPSLIARLRAEGRRVAVVAAGATGAPALRAADLGIALDSAAATAAGAAACGQDPLQVAALLHWGRTVHEVGRQSAVLGIGAAAAGLALAATGAISPVGATLVQNLGCLAVLLSGARLWAGPRPWHLAAAAAVPLAAARSADAPALKVLPGGALQPHRPAPTATGSGARSPGSDAPPAESGAQTAAGGAPSAKCTAQPPQHTARPPAPPAPPAADALAVPQWPTHGGSPAAGLSSAEARRRLQQCGPNTLPDARRPGFLRRFVDQLKDAMVLVLVAGGALALAAGRRRDAATIFAVLALNATVGAVQAGRADGSLDALRRLAAPDCRVRRDGQESRVPAATLVPGDVVLLEPGDRVPADGVLLRADALAVDEALLTGESLPVSKEPAAGPLHRPTSLGAPSWAYAGTCIARGRGELLVVGTGPRTEMGRIAAMMQASGPTETPLQRRLAELGRFLLHGSLLVGGGVAVAGLLRRQPLLEALLGGVSLAVAAIPEGLPTFVTLGLAMGVQRLAQRRALVRRLPAVETLGCATMICTDKTGTLTHGEMTVRAIWAGGKEWQVTGAGYDPAGEYLAGGAPVQPLADADLRRLLTAGVLCNDARLVRSAAGWQVLGDTTEGALLVAAAKAGFDLAPLQSSVRLAERPFEASRRRMAVLCADPCGRHLVCCKGAPEVVLAVCDRWLQGGQAQPLTPDRRRAILAAADALAGQALRVLAVAYKPHAAGDELEEGLIFAGLAGMIDPPRPESAPALAACRRAGIGVIMLTGDHPATAGAIAREIGLLAPGEPVVCGEELAALDDTALAALAPRLRVVARASPEQKLRVVRALQRQGQVVAMTGDGVNDAPAVKAADIGIAMGRGGTEVTRQAADLVLADDNFATIVAAVEQGRTSYDNIRKAVRYLLASNTGEVGLVLASALLGLPAPLTPTQLLWLNAVGDGLPALALMNEPTDSRAMHRPPRPPGESVFVGGLQGRILAQGAQLGASSLALYAGALLLGRPLPLARSMALTTLACGQFLHAFQCRAPLEGSGRPGPMEPATVAAVGGSALLLAASLYWPALAGAFGLVPLGAADWALALGAACLGNLRMPRRRPDPAAPAGLTPAGPLSRGSAPAPPGRAAAGGAPAPPGSAAGGGAPAPRRGHGGMVWSG